jgi:hypothetical protein
MGTRAIALCGSIALIGDGEIAVPAMLLLMDLLYLQDSSLTSFPKNKKI